MKLTANPSHRSWLAFAFAAVLGLGVPCLPGRPATAHETQCPACKLDVVQDTAEQDNEVALRYGRKRIEYRCVYCALSQANSGFTGDVTILAPSEIKGKPVLIARKDGKWSVSPETAVFVGQKVGHQHCWTGYRAFSSRAGFDAHVKKHPALLQDAKPLTLAQMVEIAKSP